MRLFAKSYSYKKGRVIVTNRPKQPLVEVFGFPVQDLSEQAERYRRLKLCPFNNIVPNCTKDKANDPLGVCSINQAESTDEQTDIVITCPIRFRQDWVIAEQAASFFFGEATAWTSLSEVRLKDKAGQSAGSIDLVLVAYDDRGRVTDFGALEVQAVYISGNVRKPFEYYMNDRAARWNMDWSKLADYYPRPDFLSSQRECLVSKLIGRGSIFSTWQKKQAIALQRNIYESLPALPIVDAADAEVAWFLYDLQPHPKGYTLQLSEVVYTEFSAVLTRMMTPEPGNIQSFIDYLQLRLDETSCSFN
ncbi:MAG: hypothetical protein DYG89_13115 [Caldilinea sp. CFX5]|nr:hypothetical protein [Caldilinea sp. CFX5]